MKKYHGVWVAAYLAVFYFVYTWVYIWRFDIECVNSVDCAPNLGLVQLLLLVIIPALGAVIGLRYWKNQTFISKILLIASFLAIIYFLYQYLTPSILG